MDINKLEERADKALNYLAETDMRHAELKARQNRLSELRKTTIAMGFESAEGTAEARRQSAHNTQEYRDHIDLQEETDVEYHTIDNRRKSALAIIDLYRTVSANSRRG